MKKIISIAIITAILFPASSAHAEYVDADYPITLIVKSLKGKVKLEQESVPQIDKYDTHIYEWYRATNGERHVDWGVDPDGPNRFNLKTIKVSIDVDMPSSKDKFYCSVVRSQDRWNSMVPYLIRGADGVLRARHPFNGKGLYIPFYKNINCKSINLNPGHNYFSILHVHAGKKYRYLIDIFR